MIKLLHITSSLKVGGAETVLCDLVEGLGNEQFEHHVIYFHDGPRADRLRLSGAHLYLIGGAVSLYDPVFFVRLFRLIKRIQPNCIHSLLWAANVASRIGAWIYSIPHISVYHNNVEQDGRLRNMLDRATRRFSSRLIAVSHQVAQSIRASQKKYRGPKITVILNGIDSAGVRIRSEQHKVDRSELGLSDDHFVIGSVGRFCPVKNYPFLISSFAYLQTRFSQARLVLVGLGPDEQALRSQADALGITNKVRFVVGQSSYGYYPLFDCFVQPTDKEGISMALLESMSCGVPSVVMGEQMCHPVVTSGLDGLVVDQGSKEALSDAVEQVVNDSSLAGRLGYQAQATVDKRFGCEKMVKEYRQLLCFFSNGQ